MTGSHVAQRGTHNRVRHERISLGRARAVGAKSQRLKGVATGHASSKPDSRSVTQPATTDLRTSSGSFEGGFDSKTFNEWTLLQSLSGRTTIVSGSPLQGSGNARFEVRPGDIEPQTGSQRAEVTGPTFSEGSDIYIRDAIRIPAANSSEGPWLIVQQLHDFDATYDGSPGMAVFLDSGPELRIGPGNGSHTFWRSGKLEAGSWYELVYHVRLSHDAGVGFVEVWLNGTQQNLSNGAAREYGKTMIAAQTYLKVGIYRSAYSTGTAVVEHDAIAIGDSLASVK